MTPPADSALTPLPMPLPRAVRPRLSLPVILGTMVLPLYALDQWTKHLTVAHLSPDAPKVILPGFFSLVYWTNRGAAFGMFQNQYVFFLALSAVALTVLAILYRRGFFDDPLPRAGFALLIPGILGNLTDRLARGEVVDFLLFDLHVPGAHPWPAFNVADSCICMAVGCFLLGSWQDYRAEERQKVEGGRLKAE